MLQKLNQVLSLFTPERTELSVSEVAALLQRPRSTVYRLLANIKREGFLDQDDVTGLYRLGIRLATLGELAAHSTSIQRLILPVLRRLNRETGETATLMLLAGNEGITVDVVESYQPLMTPGLLGLHHPLHASAGGKAFLAWLPEDRRDQLIKPPLKRYTPTTITDVPTLMRELEVSRRRGYAVVNGEFTPDVVGAAAPIWNHQGTIVAALTVGGPRNRVTSKKRALLGRAVISECASASRMLGYRLDFAQRDGCDPSGEQEMGKQREAISMAGINGRARSGADGPPSGRARGGMSRKRG